MGKPCPLDFSLEIHFQIFPSNFGNINLSKVQTHFYPTNCEFSFEKKTLRSRKTPPSTLNPFNQEKKSIVNPGTRFQLNIFPVTSNHTVQKNNVPKTKLFSFPVFIFRFLTQNPHSPGATVKLKKLPLWIISMNSKTTSKTIKTQKNTKLVRTTTRVLEKHSDIKIHSSAINVTRVQVKIYKIFS